MSAKEKARPIRYQRRPRQKVHPRWAHRESNHICWADALVVFAGAILAICVLAAAAGIYSVGYDNGLAAQEVEHAQR